MLLLNGILNKIWNCCAVKKAVQRVNTHRANIVDATASGQPKLARELSHSHLAYIEETLFE